MKTIDRIKEARGALCRALETPGLKDVQRALFGGMLNALAWVCDSPNGTTLDRLLAGEPIAAGKNTSAAEARLRSLVPLKTNCHPEANGRQPQIGDQKWNVMLPLEDGTTLRVSMGKEGRDLLFGMLIADCAECGEAEAN